MTMKEIRIKVTDEEYELLNKKAQRIRIWEDNPKKITPNRILQLFVSDLTKSNRSSGNEQRSNAAIWFYSSEYKF